jgi:hypothetical protein
VLLDVGCNLFGVGFLESFNSLIIGLEFFDLLFEFCTPAVEAGLNFKQFCLHLLDFPGVFLLHGLLLVLEDGLIATKGSLALVALLNVSLFQGGDFIFPRVAFLRLCNDILLFCDDIVGSHEQLLDFFFVSVGARHL